MRLLDLYCGAGGAAMGYARAGFDVVGVDLVEQPRYPFPFVRADALEVDLEGFDVVHASPPCQRYSITAKRTGRAEAWPDLIAPTRERLLDAGIPYVIENVPGAPLLDPVVVCGSSFGLGVRRHRLFESDLPLVAPPCDHRRQARVVGVYGHTGGASRYGYRKGGLEEWREAMGIEWMSVRELSEAIPPAYTYELGRQALALLEVAA